MPCTKITMVAPTLTLLALSGCARDPAEGDLGTARFLVDAAGDAAEAETPLVAHPLAVGDELAVRVAPADERDFVRSVSSTSPGVVEVVSEREETRFIETAPRPLICWSPCTPVGWSEPTGARLAVIRALAPGEAELVAELRDAEADRLLLVVE
jgi:hypothetical protein